ncbi:MAG: hypothetical protein QGI09_09865 [Dehalococcoidia bacterium]|nr:hypothetical protein [Dehalococcoidia bacterium]
MKMEVLNLSAEEKRIILLFDNSELSPEDEKVDEYLHAHDLEPKRQYSEMRDGKEYLVYYFGTCYLEDHMDQLTALASEVNL